MWSARDIRLNIRLGDWTMILLTFILSNNSSSSRMLSNCRWAFINFCSSLAIFIDTLSSSCLRNIVRAFRFRFSSRFCRRLAFAIDSASSFFLKTKYKFYIADQTESCLHISYSTLFSAYFCSSRCFFSASSFLRSFSAAKLSCAINRFLSKSLCDTELSLICLVLSKSTCM